MLRPLARATLLCLIPLAGLTACGVNPVTGKQEIQFVSDSQELQIGASQYAPTKQGDGGDYLVTLPDGDETIRIPWSRPLTERGEIRVEVVRMYEAACAQLGVEPRPH